MSEASLQAAVDAASAYEALFVPALFGQWVARVADAANLRPADHVLDVACGTGVLAREAATRVGSTGRVAGIDPNAGMIVVARRIAPEIDWRDGVAESLPFPDGSFDAVVSQFGLMFFADRAAALREMMRVLKHGGRLAIAVWDSLDNIPAYASAVSLLDRTAGQPAADALRAPFVLGNRDDLSRLCRDAGITSTEITSHRGAARFPSIRQMVEADLRGWLPMMGVVLPEEQIARLLADAEHVLGAHVTSDGRVAFDVSAHVVTATKG